MTVSAVIFDFGNVINFWQPEKTVSGLYPTKEEAKQAFETHEFMQWVGDIMDDGGDVEQSLAHLKDTNPKKYALLRCYVDNIALAHEEPVPGTLEIIDELSAAGLSILGMTNCGLEAFEALKANFKIIKKMTDVFVSAAEKCAKPEPQAYRILLERNQLQPSQCLFIDDKPANVAAAQSLGMDGHIFSNAAALRNALCARNLLKREAS